MAQSWSSQSRDDPEDFDAWSVWRNAQLALRAEADAVARDLWNQSTRSGDDLYAGNPSDLTAIGLAALDGAGSYATTAANSAHQRPPLSQDQDVRPVPHLPGDANGPTVSELEVMGRPTDQARRDGFLDGLNHSLAARVVGGGVGYLAGLPSGAVRGGWHAIKGIADGLNFARSLASPEGRARAWNEAKTATHDALQYGRSVAANPSRLMGDAVSTGTAAVHSFIPFTSMADTATGEMGHEFGIGMNGGEALANIAGLFAAPEVVGGLNAARTFAATREANIAEMMERGLNEPTARYLSKPYEGQGDHALIQKSQKSILGFETPGLRRLPIPKRFMDSPLNVSIPRGLSQYDFYKYHYGVDPQFYGGKLPVDLNGGRGFSGKRLGFERYSDPGRTWARIPPIWKDYYAGVASGEAAGILPESSSETRQ